MRLHVVSLPHTQCTREYAWCAFTQKVRKFATMMTREGHDVLLYAGTENDAECAEHIVVADPPVDDAQYTPEYSATNPIFQAMNERAAAAIRERARPHDLLCLIGGNAQKPIADNVGLMTCEFGIGYEGVFADYRVFESYAWMHTIYGALYGAAAADGRFYDAVIPNYFERDEFPAGDGSGDYLLYFGRLTSRKGLEIVTEVAKRTGIPLKVAGQGDPLDYGEYVGVVRSAEQRAELMGGARAILVPTLYLEPFGAVVVEAQMCGTPAITTDWGAFTETVEPGVTGYRCRTIAEFCDAAERAGELDRQAARERTIDRYSTETIGPLYTRYFERLAGLWGKGFYA